MFTSAFAEKSVMDKLTNDSAFENTGELFDRATASSTSTGGALISGIVTIPSAIFESVIWVLILPFNAIAMGFDDEQEKTQVESKELVEVTETVEIQVQTAE